MLADMKRRQVPSFLLLLALVSSLFGFLVYRVSDRLMNPSLPKQTETPILSTAPVQTPVQTPTPTPAPTPTPSPTPTPYVSPLSFETIRAQNPDIYAWIELPNTWLSYPILQHPSDDTYYLNRTVDGGEGYPGSLFTFLVEGKRFDQFNTVVYGHNMLDGSMFGNLKSFRSEEYMTAHREILVYTPESTLRYTVFAALTYDDRLITAYYDDRSEAQRQEYLDSLFASDGLFMTDGLTVNTDSHLLTLSTCIGGMPNNRLLVTAVLTDYEPEWLNLDY